MKNIIIVTDFSEASQNAGRYGVEIARYFNAKVFLFHAYQVPVEVPESYLFYKPEDLWSNVKEELDAEAASINGDKYVSIEICGGIGAAPDTIIAEAVKREAGLIVCGMKSSGQVLRKIFGSTATLLARKTSVPMIIVPENAQFGIPGNIALANDMDPSTAPETFNMLKELGEIFSSKLSIVSVVDEGFDARYEMRFHPAASAALKELHPVFEFPAGTNIIKTLDGFITEHSINLLAMVPHRHDKLERFFTESVTKKMIFLAGIPLLILPQKKSAPVPDELVAN